ncbi:MAG: peptidylprolyl isomerase [Azospirillum sp.]|nr:peptidylprolyl isomerase [Azospirillum sp.]
MLQVIRGTVGSWIVKGLFVILIVSFGVWGIGDIFRGHGPSDTVAQIGPIKISGGQLDQEFRQQINRMRQAFGGQFDAEQARALGLLDQTLQQMVQRDLLDLAAADAGLRVSNEMIQRRIQEQPGFRDAFGKFSPEVFRQVLAANGLAEASFVETMRHDIAREALVGAVVAGADAPSRMVEDLYRYRNEKRVAETLTLAAAGLTGIPTPDEATLQGYHDDHTVQFTAPEYRTLTVALLTVADLAKKVDLTDDEIRAAYEARADEFIEPEKRTIVQVVFDDQAKAAALAKSARDGGGLVEAAKSEKLDPVTLDSVSREDLAELGDVAFGLTPGQISDPVETPLGWHVLSVSAIKPGSARTLAEVRDQVAADLRREKATDRLYETSNQLDDAIAGGATLEEAAATLGVGLIKVTNVDAAGKRTDGSAYEGVADLAEILPIAFNLADRGRSQITETKSGSYFVARVDETTPARLKPLAEVHAQVLDGWQAEQRTKLAETKAKEIAEQLKAGHPAAEVASAAGAVAGVTEPLLRTPSSGGPLPADLVTRLFTLTVGGVASAATAEGQVVARLKEIVPADPTAQGAALDPVKRAVVQSVASDLGAQFVDGLRQRYPVWIDQARLQALFSSN